VLALSGLFPVVDRGQDGRAYEESAVMSTMATPTFMGGPFFLPDDGHEPALGLEDKSSRLIR